MMSLRELCSESYSEFKLPGIFVSFLQIGYCSQGC